VTTPNIVHPDYPAWSGTPAFRSITDGTVTALIIHHGDDALDTTPLAIDAQHRSQGWDGIGYHYVIPGDGTIYSGRPLTMVPAAAEDYNTASVDVCLCGDFQPGTDGYDGSPTPAQVESLKLLSAWLHEAIPSIERTIGHRDVAVITGHPDVATACPGDSLYALLPAIKAYVEANK
jgi:N-acetylmuramoyl-L-alanine amidase